MLVNKLMDTMEKLAPARLALDWDNVGLLVGDAGADVRKALIALDLTDAVLDEAIAIGADMIITHHPMIFKPLKTVTAGTAAGRRVIRLIKHDISCFAAHTNFDIAGGGTNDALFERLGLTEKQPLTPPDAEGFALGRAGVLPAAMPFGAFMERVKAGLGLERLKYYGGVSENVLKIGLCTGSGAEFMSAAADIGCDVYVTGDVSFHGAQAAADMGLKIVDATHYATEAAALPAIKSFLEEHLENDELEIIISATNGQTLLDF